MKVLYTCMINPLSSKWCPIFVWLQNLLISYDGAYGFPGADEPVHALVGQGVVLL